MPKSTLLLLAAAAAALIVSFAVLKKSAHSRLNEPVRSSFYFACISNGVYVTECMCLEKEAVADSKIGHINAKGDEEKAQQFMVAVKNAEEKCKQQTLSDIANDVDEAAEAVLDNASDN